MVDARPEVRIGVLLCDDVPEPDRGRHGDAFARTGGHVKAVAEALGWRPTVVPFDVRAAPPPPADSCDVFITTGSATSPDSDEPWVEWLRAWLRLGLTEGQLRVFGVCFGHQLAAHALGAPVGRAPAGWQVGATPIVQRLRLAPGGADDPAWSATSADADAASQAGAAPAAPVRLLQSHQDEVHALPEGARLWLTDDHSPVQGFAWRGPTGGAVVGVQGHPEFVCEQARDLYRRRRPVLGDARCDAAIASADAALDGLPVSAEALRWLVAGRINGR